MVAVWLRCIWNWIYFLNYHGLEKVELGKDGHCQLLGSAFLETFHMKCITLGKDIYINIAVFCCSCYYKRQKC